MTEEAWRRRIGEEGWRYVTDLPVKLLDEGNPEEVAAEILTRLYEVGWRGPERPPRVDPRGTRVLWPSAMGGNVAVLTSEGLAEYWAARGHRWLLLRTEQACKAMAGPLAARWQEFLAAYESQCDADNIDPIPEWADWRVFVGGESPTIDADRLIDRLSDDG